MIATAAMAVALLTAAGPVEVAENDQTVLDQAAKYCSADEYVEDDGHSIVFDDDDTDPALVAAVVCVLGLTQPAWVIDVVANTTSQWGLVRTETDGYTILNSYHPDDGMFLVIYDEEGTQTNDDIPAPTTATTLRPTTTTESGPTTTVITASGTPIGPTTSGPECEYTGKRRLPLGAVRRWPRHRRHPIDAAST